MMAAHEAAFFLSVVHQCDFRSGKATVARFGSRNGVSDRIPAPFPGFLSLQKYMPRSFEAYQQMDEADLKALVARSKAMGPGK